MIQEANAAGTRVIETDGNKENEGFDLNSDLDECSDIWRQELGRYIMESYRREKGITVWFERQQLVCFPTSSCMRYVSHYML
jgi:hypothetical protein